MPLAGVQTLPTKQTLSMTYENLPCCTVHLHASPSIVLLVHASGKIKMSHVNKYMLILLLDVSLPDSMSN
jgi:hypothetical protein